MIAVSPSILPMQEPTKQAAITCGKRIWLCEEDKKIPDLDFPVVIAFNGLNHFATTSVVDECKKIRFFAQSACTLARHSSTWLHNLHADYPQEHAVIPILDKAQAELQRMFITLGQLTSLQSVSDIEPVSKKKYSRKKSSTTMFNQEYKEKNYVCQHCNKIFVRPYDHAEHVYVKHTDGKFKCLYRGCMKAFSSLRAQGRHIKEKHLRTFDYKCDQPGCEFSNGQIAVVEHHKYQVHNVGSGYKCNNCGEIFGASKYGKRHEKNCKLDKKKGRPKTHNTGNGEVFETSEYMKRHEKNCLPSEGKQKAKMVRKQKKCIADDQESDIVDVVEKDQENDIVDMEKDDQGNNIAGIEEGGQENKEEDEESNIVGMVEKEQENDIIDMEKDDQGNNMAGIEEGGQENKEEDEESNIVGMVEKEQENDIIDMEKDDQGNNIVGIEEDDQENKEEDQESNIVGMAEKEQENDIVDTVEDGQWNNMVGIGDDAQENNVVYPGEEDQENNIVGMEKEDQVTNIVDTEEEDQENGIINIEEGEILPEQLEHNAQVAEEQMIVSMKEENNGLPNKRKRKIQKVGGPDDEDATIKLEPPWLRKRRSSTLRCKVCPSALASKEEINKHMSVVHISSHKCDTCGKRLTTKYNLKRHQTLHTQKNV